MGPSTLTRMCRHTLAMSPDVFLVCFDQRHRVLLLKPSPPAGTAWALPALRRDQGEPCTHAAVRLAVAIAPPGCLRFGAVTGRPDAPHTVAETARHGP